MSPAQVFKVVVRFDGEPRYRAGRRRRRRCRTSRGGRSPSAERKLTCCRLQGDGRRRRRSSIRRRTGSSSRRARRVVRPRRRTARSRSSSANYTAAVHVRRRRRPQARRRPPRRRPPTTTHESRDAPPRRGAGRRPLVRARRVARLGDVGAQRACRPPAMTRSRSRSDGTGFGAPSDRAELTVVPGRGLSGASASGSPCFTARSARMGPSRGCSSAWTSRTSAPVCSPRRCAWTR